MPEKIKPGIWEMAIELHEQGRTYSEIVEKTGISAQALALHFRESHNETKNENRFRKNVGRNKELQL
jgi:hypothetical protein